MSNIFNLSPQAVQVAKSAINHSWRDSLPLLREEIKQLESQIALNNAEYEQILTKYEAINRIKNYAVGIFSLGKKRTKKFLKEEKRIQEEFEMAERQIREELHKSRRFSANLNEAFYTKSKCLESYELIVKSMELIEGLE